MHGNYRNHYLLASQSAAPATSESTRQQPQQQHQQQQPKQQQQQQHPHQAMSSNLNGLPAVAASNGSCKSMHYNHHQTQISPSPPLPSNYPPAKTILSSKQQQQQQRYTQEIPADDCQLINWQGFSNRHLADQQQQQHRLQTNRMPTTDREYRTSSTTELPVEPTKQRTRQRQQQQFSQSSSNNNNNHQMLQSNHQQREFLQQQQRQQHYEDTEEASETGLNGHLHHNRDHYASQLRNSQLQQRFQAREPSASCQFSATSNSMQPKQLQQQQQQQQQQSARAPAGPSSNSRAPAVQSAQQQQQQGKSASAVRDSYHVNFNRGNQATGADEEEGDSRKKKYLTAKYGQQQMSLIKKRLKIETWLYEQLQELSKGSKSQAELDEIDVDLDQLLDMDDDDTRRRWLKETLRPFEDVDGERIDKFIEEVLEQSKLL